ncbi:MAG: hypothetical protein WBM98_13210 [Maribacter sp.]|uniref:hypothetical protein n=1 Tax=Maribacter sp. TaxID=1897614 RepID=UPI003C7772C8
MDQFIIELGALLEKTLAWSEEFKKGIRNYAFDVDDEIYEISRKYNKDFNKDDLNLFYNLLDFYCDAIKHDFKRIDNNYSVLQAKSDIETLKNILGNNFVIELPKDLKDRLKNI